MLFLLLLAVCRCDARKYLFYTTTVGDAYVRMAKLSFSSFAQQLSVSESQCELLVITIPLSRAAVMRSMKDFKFRYHVFETDRPHSLYMLRYTIDQWPSIKEYDVALYFDNDVIINRPFDSTLQLITSKHKFYASTEKDYIFQHTHIFFSLQTYTPEQLAQFARDNVKTFNSGLFAFFVTDEMLAHMDALFKWATAQMKAGVNHFTDQSFVNVYMNSRGLSETNGPFAPDNVVFYAQPDKVYEKQTFLHFIAGGVGSVHEKYALMTRYIKHTSARAASK